MEPRSEQPPINVETQVNPLDRNIKSVEDDTGYKFKGPVKLEYSEPVEVEIGGKKFKQSGCGWFDYDKRTIFIDKDQSDFSEEEIKDHELKHILEIDVLGEPPMHAHLLHASEDEKERKRVLGMVTFIRNKDIQKFLFGQTEELNMSLDNNNLTKLAVKLESAIFSKIKSGNLDIEEMGLISFVATDLRCIKTALFAGILDSYNLAINFERNMQQSKLRIPLLGGNELCPLSEEWQILKKTAGLE